MPQIKDIIRRPVITEKATWLKDSSNKYVFEVHRRSNSGSAVSIGLLNVPKNYFASPTS